MGGGAQSIRNPALSPLQRGRPRQVRDPVPITGPHGRGWHHPATAHADHIGQGQVIGGGLLAYAVGGAEACLGKGASEGLQGRRAAHHTGREQLEVREAPLASPAISSVALADARQKGNGAAAVARQSWRLSTVPAPTATLSTSAVIAAMQSSAAGVRR